MDTPTIMTAISPEILIPLAAGAAIALFAPVIGAFTVIRRYSLVADTLAHVALLGVSISLVLDAWSGVMPFIVAVLAAIFLEYLRSSRRVSGDSALAMLLNVGLAASVTITSAFGKELNEDILFGSLEAVTASDLVHILIVGTLVLAVLLSFWKELVYTSFDEETARVQGVPTRFINIFLMIIAALTVAYSIRVVGVLLVGALMVIPVNAALQLGASFRGTIFWSVILSLISVLAGVLLASMTGMNPGGVIVLISFLFLLAGLGYRRFRTT